ncbi:pitrilysin family protein [Paraglaciecola sp. 25GB23A]|uniref:M16 family metallopeptidase n=1 Tax=Paraglaciecola sp. 25GB23A TaxID=3156068 RepID=UPI0032AF64E0
MNMIFKSALLATIAQFSATAFSVEFTLPHYEKIRLENGLNIYLMEQHEVPLIDVTLVVKAGATLDTIPGLAKTTAENLLLGTQSLSRAEFEQQVEFVGTQIDSGAGIESSYISASMANKDHKLIIPMLRDILLKPRFDEKEFAAQKERLIADLERKKESPRAAIGGYFNALLFDKHPYANDIDGNSQSLASMELADIKEFHKVWYTPDNSAIIIAGDFKSSEMLNLLKSLFGQWQGSTKNVAPTIALPIPTQSKVLLVNKGDATESTFVIGGPGIARDNKDFVAISVVNTVLGGRFTSWLNDELRVNSGLTYGARSRFDTKIQGGSFVISTFTKTETTQQAIDLALKTYARIWEKGIDSETLESAKAYVKGQFPPRYETSSDLASLLADMFIYDFDEQYINSFSEQVNQLTPERSKEIIAKYFPKSNLQFVVIGQSEVLKTQLQAYGKIIETDIKFDSFSL